HENFDEYAFWKSRLFARCRKAIMNMDDRHWAALLPKERVKLKTFGRCAEADYVCENLTLVKGSHGPGVKFSMNEHPVVLNLPGTFNGMNAAGAIAAARELGVPWKDIQTALNGLKIPGRVEPVDTGGRTSVLVDYAHNGISLRQLLTDLRKYEPRRLILVFGCGGNRDRNRRFEMGRAAAELADFTVVTSDNPRKEKPEDIIKDITDAMEASGAEKESYIVICDRAQAIRTAVRMGTPDDIVLIAGKGHETYQLAGDAKIHFDDRQIVTNMGD
ncbi:MAG: UDP-N-acetylmuramoyl-L-alanyl-D-glutamate--2,6-diaminopimelate ligase, partial [Firmicutes bacterium]|nr:UDP-N-acetylmuramoyl-L-alanyl-D-glutamate--2,6-diaminopimelate ligase [Bacillota bacterium]